MRSRLIALAGALVLASGVALTLNDSFGPVTGQAADVYNVDSFVDDDDVNPNDTVCDSADDDAMVVCSLRAAIQSANYDADKDTIMLPNGEYKLDAKLGDLPVTNGVEILGVSQAGTIIDGGRNLSDDAVPFTRIFDVDDADLELSNMTLRRGEVAVFLNSIATLTADHITVEENSASDSGAITSNGGEIALEDSAIRNNEGPYGAGLYAFGAPVSLLRTTLSGNVAGADGGAMFFTSNIPDVVADRPTGKVPIGLRLTDVTLDGNEAGNDGGGLYLGSDSHNLNRVTLSNNRADELGGGLFANADVNIRNSTISGNRAELGGGAYLAAGQLDFWHATIAFNIADGRTSDGPVSWGGGVYNSDGVISLLNTILSNNISIDEANNCAGIDPNSQGHNLADDDSCGLAETGDIIDDPGLRDLALNAPGLTATHALPVDSPAVDKAEGGEGCLSIDQRTVTRPKGDGCDIGAYELEEPPTPTPTNTPTRTNTPVRRSPTPTRTSTPEPTDTPVSVANPIGVTPTFTPTEIGGGGAGRRRGLPDAGSTYGDGGTSLPAFDAGMQLIVTGSALIALSFAGAMVRRRRS